MIRAVLAALVLGQAAAMNWYQVETSAPTREPTAAPTATWTKASDNKVSCNECQVLCGDAGLQMPCIPDDATNLAFMTQVATEVNNQAFLGLRFSGGAWSWPAGCGADYGTYNNWYGSAPSGAEGDCVTRLRREGNSRMASDGTLKASISASRWSRSIAMSAESESETKQNLT